MADDEDHSVDGRPCLCEFCIEKIDDDDEAIDDDQ